MATNNSINDTELPPYLAKAGGTMAGAINMGSHQINAVTDPTLAQDAATKSYVDSVVGGTNPAQSVVAASTGALTVTYSNGTAGVGATLTNAGAMAAFALDGTSPTVGQRVLIKDQASTFQNGIYTVTTVGSGAANWVLTRATNYDSASDITSSGVIPVLSGTVNTTTAWVQTAVVVTIGTDPVTFTQFIPPYPLALNKGGTNASLTASNGGIFYSTASAGAILAGTATAGLALLSGSNTTPSWSTSPPITQVNVQRFTSNGTYTPTAGTKYVIMSGVGGGGAGGGVAATSTTVGGGGGGGGGGYASAVLTVAQVVGAGSTASVTIGAGGTVGTAGSNPGNAGGNTTVVANGGAGATLITANGGSGGSAGSSATNTVNAGGAGGTASVTTGTIILSSSGQSGRYGVSFNGTGAEISLSGSGGNSLMGQGGSSAPTVVNASAVGSSGSAGVLYGGGGSGASGGGANFNLSGSAGAAGIVTIIEFISV